MAWGDSWGQSPSNNAKAVAEAFFGGRKLVRSNCVTDGWHYKLFGNIIASRVPPEFEVAEVTKAIEGQRFRRSLEFSFGGYASKTTCRHLRALGLQADFTTIYGTDAFGKRATQVVVLLNGRKVDQRRFYTLEELAEMPEWKEPPPPLHRQPNLTKLMNMELDFA